MKRKMLTTLASLALVMTAISTYGYCYFTMNQEEVPMEAKKLLKGRR